MKTFLRQLLSGFVAICIVIGSVSLSIWGAQQIKNSTLMTQSRIFKDLFTTGSSSEYLSLLKTNERRQMLWSYVQALTKGYMDFELIPINEGDTLSALSESLNDEVDLQTFTYHRRDLEIEGTAENATALFNFVSSLRQTQHFEQVSIMQQESNEDGKLTFTIYCTSHPLNPPAIFGAQTS